MHNKTPAILACMFLLGWPAFPGGTRCRAESPRTVARVAWPPEWKVFLPVLHDAPELPADLLRTLPERIPTADGAIEGRWVEPGDVDALPDGRVVDLRGVRLDLAPLFGEVEAHNTAYVFLPIEAQEAGVVELGLGADWWMKAWMNGEEILDTTPTGNRRHPPMPDDFTVRADVQAGLNILAVRFVSGSFSSVLMVGGPDHLARLAAVGPAPTPEPPPDDMAYASARLGLDFPATDEDLDSGAVVGVTVMPETQLIYEEGIAEHVFRATDTHNPRFDEPVRLLLSRREYPAEDRHLDAVVWLSPEQADAAPAGRLELTLLDENGTELVRGRIDTLFPTGIFFSMGLPPDLTGAWGSLRAEWIENDQVRGQVEQRFRVRPATPVARAGRIPLRIANETGVFMTGVPMTLGVPFPRGAVTDERRIRLLDANGRERAMQTRVTARWSRFGSIQWLLCDFTADLDGGPLEWTIEFGPDITRHAYDPIRIDPQPGGIPRVEAGRMRLSETGLAFDTAGSGEFEDALTADALRGAFVRHEDGTRFRVPAETAFEVEEAGSVKVVLRRTGWYVEPESGERFCAFVTRMELYRDSPLVRIFHTWIFTGDGNRDRIANMGWTFPLASGIEGRGFLAPGPPREEAWHEGQSLLQFDYEHYDVMDPQGALHEFPGGRAPGVARAAGDTLRLHFGTRDFWQNYPSELAFEGDRFVFYNWPRRNRPARYRLDGELSTEPGEPALPSAARHDHYADGRLSRSEWKLNVVQARFAHEGERLDFRLPDALAQDPIWSLSRRGREASTYWLKNEPETANAQGISRTEEIWILAEPAGIQTSSAAAMLRGLDAQTVRAVADPAWIAASGAFFEMHPRDVETFPEEERVFDLVARAPGQWIEHMGYYGMWIFGDIAGWNLRLDSREPQLYRAFRKGHHGWPYSWLPFARSGDPELLRLADASTRQYIDASYCHYYTLDVEAQSRGQAGEARRFRRRGRWQRATLPWVSRFGPTIRHYESQSDFLWHAYYLTGYARARDLALDWAGETRIGEEGLFGRHPAIRAANWVRVSMALQQSYLDMYQATFDPWFLVATHAVAETHLRCLRFEERRQAGPDRDPDPARALARGTHFWRTADRDFLRFSGSDEYRDVFLAHTAYWGRHYGQPNWVIEVPAIEPCAFAWRVTGDDYYLRRVAALLDRIRVSVFDADDPPHMRGTLPRGAALPTGWYLQWFPAGLAALADAGARPGPIPDAFLLHLARPTAGANGAAGGPEAPAILLLKEAGRELTIQLAASRTPGSMPEGEQGAYRIIGPDGTDVPSGNWPINRRYRRIIPADAPAGLYRLFVSGGPAPGHIEVPVSPVDTPEIIAWPEGEPAAPTAERGAQYWFQVPDGIDSFSLSVQNRGRRVTVWGPDDERAWDWQTPADGTTEPTITVQPGQAGRLWRITLPGGGGFELDPRIPPFLAVDAARWFLPGQAK